jgi:hypothetical protein
MVRRRHLSKRSFSARLIMVLLRLSLVLTLAVLAFYVWRRSHHRIMDALLP